MSLIGYAFFALLLSSAIALVATTRPAIRQWILSSYLILLALIAFFLYLVAPRTALTMLQDSGASPPSDAVAGIGAMYSVAQAVGGALLIIAIALALFALKLNLGIKPRV